MAEKKVVIKTKDNLPGTSQDNKKSNGPSLQSGVRVSVSSRKSKTDAESRSTPVEGNAKKSIQDGRVAEPAAAELVDSGKSAAFAAPGDSTKNGGEPRISKQPNAAKSIQDGRVAEPAAAELADSRKSAAIAAPGDSAKDGGEPRISKQPNAAKSIQDGLVAEPAAAELADSGKSAAIAAPGDSAKDGGEPRISKQPNAAKSIQDGRVAEPAAAELADSGKSAAIAAPGDSAKDGGEPRISKEPNASTGKSQESLRKTFEGDVKDPAVENLQSQVEQLNEEPKLNTMRNDSPELNIESWSTKKAANQEIAPQNISKDNVNAEEVANEKKSIHIDNMDKESMKSEIRTTARDGGDEASKKSTKLVEENNSKESSLELKQNVERVEDSQNVPQHKSEEKFGEIGNVDGEELDSWKALEEADVAGKVSLKSNMSVEETGTNEEQGANEEGEAKELEVGLSGLEITEDVSQDHVEGNAPGYGAEMQYAVSEVSGRGAILVEGHESTGEEVGSASASLNKSRDTNHSKEEIAGTTRAMEMMDFDYIMQKNSTAAEVGGTTKINEGNRELSKDHKEEDEIEMKKTGRLSKLLAKVEGVHKHVKIVDGSTKNYGLMKDVATNTETLPPVDTVDNYKQYYNPQIRQWPQNAPGYYSSLGNNYNPWADLNSPRNSGEPKK